MLRIRSARYGGVWTRGTAVGSVRDPATGAETAATSRAPQPPQNWASVSFEKPQDGHRARELRSAGRAEAAACAVLGPTA